MFVLIGGQTTQLGALVSRLVLERERRKTETGRPSCLGLAGPGKNLGLEAFSGIRIPKKKSWGRDPGQRDCPTHAGTGQ